jgi:hypothetical protein
MKDKHHEAPHYLTFSILRLILFYFFLSGTNVFLSAMFLNTVAALSDQARRWFKTAGKITVLYHVIVTCDTADASTAFPEFNMFLSSACNISDGTSHLE